MTETYRAIIPYESLDPLTIGASGDDEKVNRDQLELEIPSPNLLAAIYPDEPAPVANATEAARDCARVTRRRPSPLGASRLRGERRRSSSTTSSGRRPSRSCCPPSSTRSKRPGSRTPASSARTARSFRCPSRTSSRRSVPRTSPGWSGCGIPFFQNEPRNAEAYTYVGVSSRGTPVWLHTEVAKRDVKITIGQAQANHWGAGGGGKLILPGVVSDETIESNHCNLVPSPADPLRRVRRARCGRTSTRSRRCAASTAR